jgi:hypothetical protein
MIDRPTSLPKPCTSRRAVPSRLADRHRGGEKILGAVLHFRARNFTSSIAAFRSARDRSSDIQPFVPAFRGRTGGIGMPCSRRSNSSTSIGSTSSEHCCAVKSVSGSGGISALHDAVRYAWTSSMSFGADRLGDVRRGSARPRALAMDSETRAARIAMSLSLSMLPAGYGDTIIARPASSTRPLTRSSTGRMARSPMARR